MNTLKDFTGLYQLSKTLRFELKPEEQTKLKFDEWLQSMKEESIDADNLFAKDKAIFNAYKALKPILDKIHEDFITISLQSKQAKSIEFKPYFDIYRQKADLSEEEKRLRIAIGETYQEGTKLFGDKTEGQDKEEKKAKFIKALTDKSILAYIENNISNFVSDSLTKEELMKHLRNFKGFFTYFSGYNTNRENYYYVEKEKATAVATRIVHENLPKFCDNVILFEKRKEEYINAYQFLKESIKDTRIKNAKTNKFQEAEPITADAFDMAHFNQCLSQKQIEEYNRIIGNYNLLINLYNQTKQEKKDKLPEFVTLYKQIGCGKGKTLFIAILKDRENELTDKEKHSGEILTVEKLFNTVTDAGKKIFEPQKETITIPYFIHWLKSCDDWKGIYWSKSAVTTISNLYFANWHDLKDKLKGNKACVSYDKKREEQIKLNDAVELSGLFDVLDKEQTEFVFKKTLFEDDDYKDLLDKNLKPSQNLVNLICAEIEKNTKLFLNNSDKITALKKYKEGKREEGPEDAIIKQIKEWFDASIDAMHIVRYFSVRPNKRKGNTANPEMEEMLSSLLDDERADWSEWYDSIRNYLTKKPQDDVKENMMKLNFGKGNLLGGFADSYTKTDNGTQYGGYIFRKKNIYCGEYEYYLGISANAKLFRCHLKDQIQDNDKSEFERLDYYQMKSTTPYPNSYEQNKKEIQDIVKRLTGKAANDDDELKKEADKINRVDKDGNIAPTELYRRLQKSEQFKSILDDRKLEECVDKTIKNIKDNCRSFSRIEEINRLQTITYKGFDGFLTLLNQLGEITKNAKLFDYFQVSQKEFNNALKDTEKPLFLFKIDNKDLSYCETFEKGERKKRGNQKENLHTTFFRALMREFNGCDSIIDIGKGEVFFREKAFTYSKEILERGHHYEKLKDKFKYPIISNKRFANNKYLFHLSVFLNYSSKSYKNSSYAYAEVNSAINNTIQQNPNLQFLGIDRGEKHLVYGCTIDKNGKIVKCGHYDNINGTDYVQKLDEKADERKIARKSWQTIGSIRNLKDGYISHVVHRIVDEVIKDASGAINPHSYIVLEDLNTEMKRGRQKIEKQVYQKLETALAKKLNFVVDKNSAIDEAASVANALQLTPPIANYQDIEGKKQFGIMLYTRANYTSITDPATGWRKTIYLKNGKDEEIKNQILEEFTDFGFDGNDFYFEYTEKHAGKTWRLFSGKEGESLPRFRNKKQKENDYNVWVPEPIKVVPILETIFKNFDKAKSFKTQINSGVVLSKVDGRDETAWQSLRFAIDLIQQIRNSGEKDSIDDNFLYSPVRDENGVYFDSRHPENNGDLSQIIDADANGAYNIARKGLIMDAHIKKWMKVGKPKITKDKKEYPDLDLFISDMEWDLWLLNREKWQEMLPTFASITAMESFRKEQK